MALSGFLFKLKTPLGNKASQSSMPSLEDDFQDYGGVRGNSFSLSADGIDITNKSSGKNRTLLDGHGTLAMEMSGDGFTENEVLHKEIQQNVLSQALRWFLIERDDGRTFIGKFKITSYQESGSHDGAVTFNISLMSSGTLYIEDESGFKYDTGSKKITSFASVTNPFNYIFYPSAGYTSSTIPSPLLRATAFDTYIKTLTIRNTDKVAGAPTRAITITANRDNMFIFPLIFLEKTALRGKKLQVLGGADVNVTPDFKRVGEYNDNNSPTPVTWVGFYLNTPLFKATGKTGESTQIKIQIGD